MRTFLAIESSCDETAAAVWYKNSIKSNAIYTQDIHKDYGGVVPELASRAHQDKIAWVVDKALKEAGLNSSHLDAIAVTRGPGLLGALLVGLNFAKSMALALDIPLVPVHHMHAHILSHFIEEPKPKFPFLCLTVSGGHTQIVKVISPLKMEQIGTTRDDAVGEAYDKAAKMLGLTYPGGPLIDRHSEAGDPNAFTFPETYLKPYDFSFSGIKTALLYLIRDHSKPEPDFIEKNRADICASYQKALVNMLVNTMEKAIKDTGIKNIALAGGVSANSYLRSQFFKLAEKHGAQAFIPEFQYCTDNAAMIAVSADLQYEALATKEMNVSAEARLPFNQNIA